MWDFSSFHNEVILIPVLFLLAGQSNAGVADAVGSNALGAAAVPVLVCARLMATCANTGCDFS